jgi:hypothetical protein
MELAHNIAIGTPLGATATVRLFNATHIQVNHKNCRILVAATRIEARSSLTVARAIC